MINSSRPGSPQSIAGVLDTGIEVRFSHPGEADACDRFVQQSGAGTFFHLSAWRAVVREVLGHESFCLVASRNREITGVFPVCRVRNRLFGDCLVSLPLAVYGGICADDRESYLALLNAANDWAQGQNVNYLEMRNLAEPFPISLPRKDLYVTFTQDLTPGPDKLLQALPRDTRYMIRKSLKAGLDWTEDLSLNEFYQIYSRSVHHLGTPVFSKKLFSALKREFPQQCRIFGVRRGRQAIAGVMCFYFRDQVLPYYGGALSEFNRDAPNNFMYWKLIEQSCREGYRVFDFGRSKRGSGSFQFKSGWSMKVVDLPYRYQLVRAREIPHLSAADQKFSAPIAVWKRLPFSWTKVLGPQLIRWIPSI